MGASVGAAVSVGLGVAVAASSSAGVSVGAAGGEGSSSLDRPGEGSCATKSAAESVSVPSGRRDRLWPQGGGRRAGLKTEVSSPQEIWSTVTPSDLTD